MFEYELFVPFHLGDPAGIVFYGHVFAFTHQAYENFVTQKLGIVWDNWFKNERWIVPIVHTEASYKHIIYSGRNILIRLAIKEIKHSSFKIEFLIEQEGNICVHIETVHAFCLRLEKAKMEIPKEIRESLTSIELQHLV